MLWLSGKLYETKREKKSHYGAEEQKTETITEQTYFQEQKHKWEHELSEVSWSTAVFVKVQKLLWRFFWCPTTLARHYRGWQGSVALWSHAVICLGFLCIFETSRSVYAKKQTNKQINNFATQLQVVDILSLLIILLSSLKKHNRLAKEMGMADKQVFFF